MLLESIILDKFRKSDKKKESFSEKLSFVDVMVIVVIALYLVVAVALWLRVVFTAFSCSVGQGLSSVLFPGLYSLYKFGDLIDATC